MFDQIQTPGLSLSLSLLGTLGDEGGQAVLRWTAKTCRKERQQVDYVTEKKVIEGGQADQREGDEKGEHFGEWQTVFSYSYPPLLPSGLAIIFYAFYPSNKGNFSSTARRMPAGTEDLMTTMGHRQI